MAEGLVPFAADDTDFIYRVQAVLATESDSAWATRLNALANQELECACPGCDEQLTMSLETSPAFVKQFDDGSVGETTGLHQLAQGGSRVLRYVLTTWQPLSGDRRLLNTYWHSMPRRWISAHASPCCSQSCRFQEESDTDLAFATRPQPACRPALMRERGVPRKYLFLKVAD